MPKDQSIFVCPEVTLYGISLGIKGGSIINYHDDDFEKIGIVDGLFTAVSLSYKW